MLDDHLSRLDAASSGLDAARRRSEVLIDAAIQRIFGEIADLGGWPIVSLGALAADEFRSIVDGPFGSNPARRHYTLSGARVVRLQNIGDGFFRQGDAFISHEHYRTLAGHDVRAGDVVVASLGEDLPRAAVVPDLGGPAIVKADCIRVRVTPGVEPDWITWGARSAGRGLRSTG